MMQQRPREGGSALALDLPDAPTHRPATAAAKPPKPSPVRAEASLTEASSEASSITASSGDDIGSAPPSAADDQLLAQSLHSFRLLSDPRGSTVRSSFDAESYVVPTAPVAAAAQPPPYRTSGSPGTTSSAASPPSRESVAQTERATLGRKSSIKSAVLPAMAQIGKSIWSSMRDLKETVVGRELGDAEAEALARRLAVGGSDIRRRVLLPFHVSLDPSQKYKATVSQLQRSLKTHEKSPQGARDSAFLLGYFDSFELAKAACEAFAPPLWSGKGEQPHCFICYHTFAILWPAHHCRNCGQLVCSKCSSKSWPGSMLPATYHNMESFLRVCCSCMHLAEEFATVLRAGDIAGAQVIYGTGNVNLRCPMSIFVTGDYPVHMAAQGGSVAVMSWLAEQMMCPLLDFSKGEPKPLLNACGLSPLAQAAKYGNAAIIRYLLFGSSATLQELERHNSSLLLRALHAALEAPGLLPDYKASSDAPHGTDEDIVMTDQVDSSDFRLRAPRLIYTKEKRPAQQAKKRGLTRAQDGLEVVMRQERERENGAQQVEGSSAPLAQAFAVAEGSEDALAVVASAVVAKSHVLADRGGSRG